MGLSFSVAPEVRPLPPSLINIFGELHSEVRALAARGKPLVSILWGRDARDARPLLGALPAVESRHPSPRSTDGGFFASRPFGRADDLLMQQGAPPVDWRLP